MVPIEEMELTDPKLNPALKYGKNLAEKRFMLNLFIKYNISWHANTLLEKFAQSLLSFWPSTKRSINDFSEKEIDIRLSQLEPQIPTEPCILSEITLGEFTSAENFSNADERIFNLMKNISATDIYQLSHYADSGNPVAQLLISFIYAGKYDESVAKLKLITNNAWLITNESSQAKKYLEQSASQYDLAKFFLSRNKLFGNPRWNITKDFDSAITNILSLTKTNSVYTILCTSLLYHAYAKGLFIKENLNNKRLNKLLDLIINDKRRMSLEADYMRCRGAHVSPEAKLSHDILTRNSLFECDDETLQTGKLNACEITLKP